MKNLNRVLNRPSIRKYKATFVNRSSQTISSGSCCVSLYGTIATAVAKGIAGSCATGLGGFGKVIQKTLLPFGSKGHGFDSRLRHTGAVVQLDRTLDWLRRFESFTQQCVSSVVERYTLNVVLTA